MRRAPPRPDSRWRGGGRFDQTDDVRVGIGDEQPIRRIDDDSCERIESARDRRHESTRCDGAGAIAIGREEIPSRPEHVTVSFDSVQRQVLPPLAFTNLAVGGSTIVTTMPSPLSLFRSSATT